MFDINHGVMKLQSPAASLFLLAWDSGACFLSHEYSDYFNSQEALMRNRRRREKAGEDHWLRPWTHLTLFIVSVSLWWADMVCAQG